MPASPSAEGEWIEKKDPKSGKTYYYNNVTRETRWSKPTGASSKPASPRPKSGQPEAANSRPASARPGSAAPTASSSSSGDLPPGWSEKKDPKTGKVYYFNRDTRETSWTRPGGASDDKRAASPTPEKKARTPEETAAWRKRMERIYRHYCPDRLPMLDSALEEHAGHEEVLLEAMTKKYGPEPPATPPASAAEPAAEPVEKVEASSSGADAAAASADKTPASDPTPESAAASSAEPVAAASSAQPDRTDESSSAADGATDDNPVSESTFDDHSAAAGTVEDEPHEQPKGPTVEDVAQKLIAAAGLPLMTRNPMQRVSNDVLLRMLGTDFDELHGLREGAAGERRRSTTVAYAPPRMDAAHPAGTQLLVLRRLNEEFRASSITLRDQYEDAMEQKRADLSEHLAELKEQHAAAVRSKYAALEQERAAAAEAEAEAAAEGRADDPEVDRAMTLLEQRLFGAKASEAEENAATATQRRLLQFWKAKYQTAAQLLRKTEEEVDADRRQLAELEEANSGNPSGFQTRVAAMRERVTAVRTEHDDLRGMYEIECQKRGITPEAPRHVTDRNLQSALSSLTKLDRAESERRTVESETTSNAGAEFGDYFITDMGYKDLKVRSQTAQYYARREEADDLERQSEAAKASVEEAQSQVLGQLDTFTEVAGSLTTAAASFYEEIVHLRAQIEAAEEAKFKRQLARAAENARHAAEMATLRHRVCEARLRWEHKREKNRRLLREKDIDLYRTERRARDGMAVEFTDFTDAPPIDVKLHLDVLKAKLAVSDTDKQLIQHRLHRAATAATETEAELRARLEGDASP